MTRPLRSALVYGWLLTGLCGCMSNGPFPGGVAPSSPTLQPVQTVPDRPWSGTVPSWALKLTAVAAVLNVFFFAFGYASTHIKSIAAPLQPPVARAGAAVVIPTPTAAPTLNTGGGRRATATLRPGIRTSPNAPLTSTRHS